MKASFLVYLFCLFMVFSHFWSPSAAVPEKCQEVELEEEEDELPPSEVGRVMFSCEKPRSLVL